LAREDKLAVEHGTAGFVPAVKDVARKAQIRLCARYRRLVRAGKPTTVVTVAIARELAAFVWAIATIVLPSLEPAA